MAVQLLKVVPAANPLGGLVPGVKVVGAANEPCGDKYDRGESKTPQPRKNNVDDGTIPVIERQHGTSLGQRLAIFDRRDALVQVQYVPMVAPQEPQMFDELRLGNIPRCPRMARRRFPNLVVSEDCERTAV